ncbi:MmpS family transport accessory protein, partial [Mycobacterium sp. UM_CSW]|uniref:MmpS family transport accessory protein n=1 Tax=Mycobacterium sp. UM_CSW TaxID=1370119 RepID=UPI0013786EEB
MTSDYDPPPGHRRPPRVWRWALGGLLVAILGLGGFVAVFHRVANHVEEGSKYGVNVTYQVEGSGSSVAITYTVGKAHSAKDSAASMPWTKDVATGGTVSLAATNDQSGGTTTCRIFANGKQISESAATGPLATASCTGDVG